MVYEKLPPRIEEVFAEDLKLFWMGRQETNKPEADLDSELRRLTFRYVSQLTLFTTLDTSGKQT